MCGFRQIYGIEFSKIQNNHYVFVSVPGLGIRHLQIALLFFLLAIAYGMRITLSVAVVAMTDNTTSSNPDVPVRQILFSTVNRIYLGSIITLVSIQTIHIDCFFYKLYVEKVKNYEC